MGVVSSTGTPATDVIPSSRFSSGQREKLLERHQEFDLAEGIRQVELHVMERLQFCFESGRGEHDQIRSTEVDVGAAGVQPAAAFQISSGQRRYRRHLHLEKKRKRGRKPPSDPSLFQLQTCNEGFRFRV